MANNKKYISLNRLSNFLDNLRNTFASLSHKHTTADITDYKVDTALSSTSSNPVQNKVIDAEFEAIATAMNALDAAIDDKAASSHTHDDRYYTESEIDTKLASKANSSHNHDSAYDTKGSASAVQENLDTVSDTLDAHTTNTDIHFTAAERTKLSGIAAGAQVNTVTGVKGNSESTYRTGNINITKANIGLGSVDNTADSAKSVKYAASAGSATSATKATQDASGNVITSTYETKTDASAKLTEAKTYADNAANTVKNDLLNNAGAAYDTLKELGDLIDDNKDAIDALEEIAAGKANATHTHAISDVSGLQSALDGKAASSHGTHVTYSTTAPVMDGTAAVGTASTVARSDHKHPTDTSRASKTEFDSHTANTTAHITASERTNWNAAKTHADSAHAPSNAQPNQNAFSNIKVGTTTIAADTTTDTLTLAGTNVTITPDATNDKVTIAVADATTSAKGVVQLIDSVTSTSTTTAATPKNVKAAYDLANTAKTTAEGKANASHTHTVTDITDLTATATELNYMDGVTSNVQAQIDSKAASNHTHSDLESDIADLDERMLRKVSKSGDTMTGNLKIQRDDGISPVFSMDAAANGSGQRASLNISKNANSSVDNGTEIEDEAFDGTTTSLIINRSAKYLADRVRIAERDANYSITEYALYGEHNKPSLYDLGAASDDHTHSATEITSGTMDAARLPKASETVSGIVTTGTQTFEGVKTFTSPIYADGGVSPSESNTTDLGDSLRAFRDTYTKNLYVNPQIVSGSAIRGGAFITEREGTTTTDGIVRLEIGNQIASGKAGNARGHIKIYNESNGSIVLQTSHDDDYSYRLNLPDHAGTLATKDDLESLASVSTLTTDEYAALEESNSINANTLYMLTDAEEEELITVEDIDAICGATV